jgi:hypothetical protein
LRRSDLTPHLRLIRGLPDPLVDLVTVLGVDEFASRPTTPVEVHLGQYRPQHNSRALSLTGEVVSGRRTSPDRCGHERSADVAVARAVHRVGGTRAHRCIGGPGVNPAGEGGYPTTGEPGVDPPVQAGRATRTVRVVRPLLTVPGIGRPARRSLDPAPRHPRRPGQRPRPGSRQSDDLTRYSAARLADTIEAQQLMALVELTGKSRVLYSPYRLGRSRPRGGRCCR